MADRPAPPLPPRGGDVNSSLDALDELEKQLSNLGGGNTKPFEDIYDVPLLPSTNTRSLHFDDHTYAAVADMAPSNTKLTTDTTTTTTSTTTTTTDDGPTYDMAGSGSGVGGGSFNEEHMYAQVKKDSRNSSSNNVYEAPTEPSSASPYVSCVVCNKPIVDKVISFGGKQYHNEHFVCTKCKQPLGTSSVFTHETGVYCETDYHELFSPRCHTCRNPIKETATVALGHSYHREHFVCKKCGQQLDTFMEHEGEAYCREDHAALFSRPCRRCAKPIVGETITALDAPWHPACFSCGDCNAAFPDGRFFTHNNEPVCELHFATRSGNICSVCNGALQGKCVTFKKRKYHPEHFCCTFCKKTLPLDSFMEKDDKPYCKACHVKNFG